MKKHYIILIAILIISLFLRIYNVHEILGFYFDQGRDAMVVWKLLHEGKFFLIGPVTGIEGIFLGPFFYYLLAPFYLLGSGSPVFVSAALSWLSVFGIYVVYLIGNKIADKETGLLASFIFGGSFSMMIFSRWLSNPNPLPLFSAIVVYGLICIYQGKSKYWFLVGLFTGLSLQLEAAAATFFLPAILVFVIWQRKLIKNKKYFIGGILLFLLTLLPQLIFNFKHDGILFQAFEKFLITEKSFKTSLWETIGVRLPFYFEAFTSKVFYGQNQLSAIFLVILTSLGLKWSREIFNGEVKILFLWLFSPLFFLLFYQGNNGYVWDYYLSGVWWVFILLCAFLIRIFAKKNLLGKIFLGVFLIIFVYINLSQSYYYLQRGGGIILKYQLAAIDWIYKDAKVGDFNVDVYVPPVIPHSFDYLFKWYGLNQYGREPLAKNVSLLYTLEEVDSPHPERLEAWMKRQAGIGKIIYGDEFGGVRVQRRERILFNE